MCEHVVQKCMRASTREGGAGRRGTGMRAHGIARERGERGAGGGPEGSANGRLQDSTSGISKDGRGGHVATADIMHSCSTQSLSCVSEGEIKQAWIKSAASSA